MHLESFNEQEDSIMRCKKAHGLMSAALDGELSAREQVSLTAHLQQCAVCGQKFHAFQEMHTLLQQAGQFPAPPALARRVMARLETTEAPPFFAPLWMNFAEAAVLALVIGIGVVSGNLISNSLVGLRHPDRGIASMSLEIFEATPPDSLGGAYLAMLEVNHEK